MPAPRWPTVKRAAHVGVRLLGERQHEVTRTFAMSGIDSQSANGTGRLVYHMGGYTAVTSREEQSAA